MTGRNVPIVAISGVKNSGKTALITAMLPLFSAAGIKTAVIKHDGHSFTADSPGTDTDKHLRAGACGTAIFDGEKFKVVRRVQVDTQELVPLVPDADLILLEGFKYSHWPKLELVRAGNSQAPVCDPASLLALVTDLPLEADGVPVIPFGDARAAANIILDYVERGERP